MSAKPEVTMYLLCHPLWRIDAPSCYWVYVGQATNAEARYQDHLHGKNNSWFLAEEISRLEERGEEPRLIELDKCDYHRRYHREALYIELLALQGHKIMNMGAPEMNFALRNLARRCSALENYVKSLDTEEEVGQKLEQLEAEAEKIKATHEEQLAEQTDRIMRQASGLQTRISKAIGKVIRKQIVFEASGEVLVPSRTNVTRDHLSALNRSVRAQIEETEGAIREQQQQGLAPIEAEIDQLRHEADSVKQLKRDVFRAQRFRANATDRLADLTRRGEGVGIP